MRTGWRLSSGKTVKRRRDGDTRIRLTDRVVPATLLLVAIAALSWAYVATIEPYGMDVGVLLRPQAIASDVDNPSMSGVDQMEMPGSNDTHRMEGMEDDHAMSIPLFLTGWVAMMSAMMLPAVIPMVLLVTRWSRSQAQPTYRLVAFVGGYLLVWGSAGVFYYALIEILDARVPASEGGARVAASVLLLSGVYQFSPLKDRCLSACRTPLGFLMTYGNRMGRGWRGYLEVGARHGLFCLGCCWMLMVVLVLLGVMNVLWMLVVSAVIFVEKVTRSGAGFSKLAGAATAVVGIAIIFSPRLLVS